jgi:hypothetical protein
MNYKVFLIIINLGLLSWLLIESTFQLDLSATKNDYLSRIEQNKISHFEDIDAVKSFAISKINQRRAHFKQDSVAAVFRIRLIIGVIVGQILLVIVVIVQKKKLYGMDL